MELNNATVSSSPTDSSTSPPHKLAKLEEEDSIKSKLSQYLDEFASAVRTGKFVVQTKLDNVPTIGLQVIETGKLLKFPLQEDEVAMEELAASDFEIKNNDEWVKLEATIIDKVGHGFGLSAKQISISLKKLIIQKTGDRFPTNLDELFDRSEQDVDNQGQNGRGEGQPSNRKQSFGHLVIHLPSHYTGGQFRFDHGEQLKEFDMSASMNTKEGWTAQYLAYFPQLEQTHGEILSGVRSCLIYNLEIEGTNATPLKLPPRAPTIKNIVPSFSQIIQDWKQRSDKTVAKLLHLIYTSSGIKPSVISTFLAPTLRDNGVTLFHGTSSTFSELEDSEGSGDDDAVLTKLRVLASPNGKVEKAFANFLRDEPIGCPDFEDDDDEDSHHVAHADNRGLKFDLEGHEMAQGTNPDKFVFFLSRDENVDVFKDNSWIRSVQFWRFQSYLFLEKCADFDQHPTSEALFRAAQSLVSIRKDEAFSNLFPNLTHFKNVLDKFVLLDDPRPLTRLLKICTDFLSYSDTLFPTLLNSGMPWCILKSGLKNLFNPVPFESELGFYIKVHRFTSHIETGFHLRDKNCEEFYFQVFDSILQKLQGFQDPEEFVDSFDVQAVISLLRISEIMKHNLFKFMKSRRPTFVREVLVSSCKVGPHLGVMWVRLVTDLYCCTKLLEKWPNEEEEEFPREADFLVFYFQLAERVGADVKGILGNVKKYQVLVRALSRFANSDERQPGAKVGVLSKFWIPFATRLEARIEAVMYSDVIDRARQESANLSVNHDYRFSERAEMLQEIRTLLTSAKEQ